jgi:hypothetical protein
MVRSSRYVGIGCARVVNQWLTTTASRVLLRTGGMYLQASSDIGACSSNVGLDRASCFSHPASWSLWEHGGGCLEDAGICLVPSVLRARFKDDWDTRRGEYPLSAHRDCHTLRSSQYRSLHRVCSNARHWFRCSDEHIGGSAWFQVCSDQPYLFIYQRPGTASPPGDDSDSLV